MTRICKGLSRPPSVPAAAVVTIGVFDGVHLAHQALIRRTVVLARALKGTSVAVTFDPDPGRVLHPERAPLALSSLQERCRLMSEIGLDRIWVIPFTRRVARISGEAFARLILVKRLKTRCLVVGSDFAFGRGASGNIQTLRTIGVVSRMQVEAMPPICTQGLAISSSRIRRLILEGKLSQARRLLGRFPTVSGRVIRGSSRGRLLRMPTANIQVMPQIMPPQGVYAVIVSRGGRRWRGVMNLGVRPTFGGGPLVCEVHLLGFSGRLYGKHLSVSLVARLRSERCFSSIQALSRQMRRDIARARKRLSRLR
jgi:riboflavin kinase/FMN adenylyltransferase